MQIFHIIEETADQQTLEIRADCLADAIGLYLSRCTHEQWDYIDTTNVGRIRYNFPTEYCIVTAHTNQIIFVRWISKPGLY